MAMDFGKLNFAVGFNRTSAFPLDANSYFETYAAAETAAAGAAVVGSADSAYYIGQLIIVKDTTEGADNKGVGLYQIGADRTLKKFGQASSADELATAVSALEARCDVIEGKLILASASGDGLMSQADFEKLTGIAAGAQVNVIEGIKLDDVDVAVGEGKKVNLDIAGTYLKKTDAASTYVAKEEDKGLSSNDYDDAAVAEVAKIASKADTSVVEGVAGRVSTLEGQIVGLTGAMHFKGVVAALPEDLSSYVAGDVIIVGGKEYVCSEVEGVKSWHELGDEGSHLTKTEAASTYETIEAATASHNSLSGEISGVSTRVTTIENDYLKAADKTELQGAIDGKVSQSAFDELGSNLNGLGETVAAIEADYLTSTDKTALEAAIGGKVAQGDFDTLAGRVTANETAIGVKANAEAGTAATGIYKEIADEVSARTTLAATVGEHTTNIGTLQLCVGTADDAAAADGSLYARVASLSERVTDVEGVAGSALQGITLNGETVEVGAGNIAAITLPAAFISSIKAGETDLVVTDGALELHHVSTDKLTQGTKTLILNGGNSLE